MNLESDNQIGKLRILAESQNDPCAQLSLARMYQENLPGLPADINHAHALYLAAATSGLDTAQFELALWYAYNGKTDADVVQTEYWLVKSASQGYTPAQTNLGRMLIEGTVLKQDIPRGLNWLLTADSNGGREAHQILERIPLIFENKDQVRTGK